jgi:preprotein translocase subunit YajC
MLALLQLLADGEPAKAQPDQPSIFSLLVPALFIMAFFYIFMIRGSRKQENERQRLLSSLKKNDKVETAGGIIGIVANVKDKEDEVTLKVDENSNVRLRVTRRSIVRIFGDEANKDQKEAGAEK